MRASGYFVVGPSGNSVRLVPATFEAASTFTK